MLAQAVAHHQAGRLAEAERGYRAVLTAEPRNADALHLLGVVALQSGRAGEAVTLIGKALAQAKGVPDYWDNLGSALSAAGRPDDAVQAHRKAATLDPQGAQRRHNLGNALGVLGHHEEAEQAFAAALALKPDYAKAWYNLGNGHAARHRHGDAVAALDHAVRLVPGMVEAHNNLGDALAMSGRLDEAIAQHRLVARHRPDDATAQYNLGAVLQQKGALESAEIAYRQALKRNPRHSAALNNLGSVLKRLGRPDQAEICHRQALEHHPEFVEARYNLGNALQALGRYDEAAVCFEEALAQQPDLATATYNLSLLALRHGDLTRGWTGYERRFAAGEAIPDRRFDIPRWGGQLLRGKRLLVWREQGVGDEVLFASCYPDVVAWAGGPVTIECDPRLVPLFRRSFPKATVRAESCTGDAFGEIPRETIVPPDCDLQVPAGDLPELLRGNLSAFEPQPPWLVPDPALVERWRERLAALGPGLRIGIGWRSQLMTAERKASYVLLEHWGPLFAVPGLVFVNLQYGDCEAELRVAEQRFGVTIHRWADLDLKDDFDGAAALTANLDLVISPAMSAGELAGALGVPVWRFGSRDWTQLGAGVRPWFPSMRLFQPNAGEGLEAMLVRMAVELARAASGKPPLPLPVPDADGRPGSETDRLTANAVAHYRAGDAAAADTLVRQVLDSTPGHPVALHLAGVLAKRRGALEEAQALLVRAVAADPVNASAHAALSEVCQGLGRFDAAERASRTCVAMQPDGVGHWVNRTALLRRLGLDGEARSAVAHALRLRPDLAPAHGHRAELALRPEDAVAAHRIAVALMPGAADMLSNLGTALHKLDRFAEAARTARRAIRSDPGLAVAWTNLGNSLEALGRAAEAEACHRTAIGLAPSLAEAHGNLAYLLKRQSRHEEALAAFDAALQADPKHAQSHFNRALLLLETGVLRSGWSGYDWRFGTPAFRNHRRRLSIRAWRGENIAGRRLLVWREQGVGDEFLFASCYDEAMRRAGRLVIECDSRRVRLFARSFPDADVRPESTDPRDADVQIAAGSLPRLLRTELKRFPERTSWLVPDPVLVERWRERLAALGPGLRIGIGWRSQLMTAERKAAYVLLEHWGPLFAVPGLVFVNLQYGDCEAELRAAEERFGVTIHRWADLDLKDDFDGAAALTANLDLVISPAMSAGELAGALGVPVWRFGSRDWTQLGSGVRPWFPSMRLFQPNTGEGLEAALVQMAKALRATASPRGRGTAPAGASVGIGDGETTDPDPDRLLEQAVAAHRAGSFAAAAPLYERVLAHRPRDPVALHLSGLLAHQTGAPERGEARIAAAVAAAPDYATAHISLGNVRLALGRAGPAAAGFRTALALQPGNAAALTNLGNAFDALERSGAAVPLHRRAVAADPDLAEAYDNLGAALARLGRWGEAERAHAQALRRAPALEAGWVNLSVALRRLGRLNAAERAGRYALALAPALADGMANRGRLLREMGDDAAAALWCGRALAAEPGHAAAAFNAGVLDLAAGRLAQGWEGYDRRFDTRDLTSAVRRPAAPLWTGGDLSGKSLLVWREQGIGDELMFAQRLPELIARAGRQGGRIVVECDPRFVPLFARSFPQATVRAVPASLAEPSTDVDCHLPIGSLSRHLGASLTGFAGLEPALRADPAAVDGWRRRLAELGEGLRVGIAWRSGQLDPDRMPDYTRIEDWQPVLTLPGLIPVNLQYGDCGAELAAAREAFGRAPHAFPDLDLRNDLDGTAALMSALDLVIAPATSTGELAAALGVPVWRLARTGDWTMLGTGVRPWFPSMRLFRTGPGQQVADLLPAVAAELARPGRAIG
ncbi:tetratricopeptide repeat protein [Azospirillum sp. Sh1]|nr:tetratricopeptide repeat protein [Azospirillum sp. Sh1]